MSLLDIESEGLRTSYSMNCPTTLHSTPRYWTTWTQERIVQTHRQILSHALCCTQSLMHYVWLEWWAHSAVVTWYHLISRFICWLLAVMRMYEWLWCFEGVLFENQEVDCRKRGNWMISSSSKAFITAKLPDLEIEMTTVVLGNRNQSLHKQMSRLLCWTFSLLESLSFSD